MEPSMNRPKYWELLSPDDQAGYTALQHDFCTPTRKNRRNRSIQTFGEILDEIKRFVVRYDDDDWKRSLVCGICWFDSRIGMNTRQLRVLVSRCKSSINGSFQMLGYGMTASGADCSNSIVYFMPILKDNFAELRQWTLRYPDQPAFVSPAPDTRETPVGVGIELMPSPTEPLRETECFGSSIFEDPLSFVPCEPHLKGWSDLEDDIAKAQKDFDFPDLDL
jgi:hypothetical protein